MTALPQTHLRCLAEGGGELWAAGTMGQAPFNRRVQSMPPEERFLQDISRASSLEIHLRRRFLEKQLEATTPEAYKRPCQETALSPALLAYRWNQGPVLAALLPVEWAVPEPLGGPKLRGYWLVVYSLERNRGHGIRCKRVVLPKGPLERGGMVQKTPLASLPSLSSLELARWRWREVKRFLERPEAYNPDEALVLVEEFPLLEEHLRDLYAEDPEPALALAQEIFAERERLLAQGIRLPETPEALLS
ncbi:MAG: hypothetical protein NZ849_06220 [Meiothermus sp.]|uniref:hypothetical protein n=1 Tax=Meiothermus sp. TaxID=1955249 RepID=UPI0025FFEF0C|nr:hypothetical protein [Meiothermus sp.]MCS7194494.1 hypothetical protein [Meiothermus sp.]